MPAPTVPKSNTEAVVVANAPLAVVEPPPVVASVEAPVVVPNQPSRLVIQPGNNLWKLSRQIYGKGRMFTIIYEANRDQLRNPNRIFPGQILTAPTQKP